MVKNNHLSLWIKQLYDILPASRILINEPMSQHTTFKIGGPADCLVLPMSIKEVSEILHIATKYNISVLVLGNGSNMLVLDKGIRGLVLKLGHDISHIKHSDATVTAGAGALLADVSRYAAAHSLTGLEFAVGIPGSIGGAVFMNAGAYDGEMSYVVETVVGVCYDGSVRRFVRTELDFAYRHSIFHEVCCIICEVEFVLKKNNLIAIQNKMDEFTTKRKNKQPIEMPSAGSTFKRPPNHFAGTLIEEAELKGFSIGGAQVSNKHAGFVINTGAATAQDVLTLIKEVQQRVYQKSGVMLQPEVRILGEE